MPISDGFLYDKSPKLRGTSEQTLKINFLYNTSYFSNKKEKYFFLF